MSGLEPRRNFVVKLAHLGPERWILVPGAFPPIVDKATFDRVQTMLPRNADRQWSDQRTSQKTQTATGCQRAALGVDYPKGAWHALQSARFISHFGPYKQMYALIDYHPPVEDIFRTAQTERSMVLRRELINRIKTLFPKNVTVFHFPNRTRSVLRLDNDFNVSVVLCRTRPRDPQEASIGSRKLPPSNADSLLFFVR